MGIKYIVVDDRLAPKPKKLLQKVLRDKDKFKIVYKARIKTNISPHITQRKRLMNEGTFITIYKYLNSKPFKNKKITIPNPITGTDIEIESTNN